MTAQVTAPRTHAPIPDLGPPKVEPMVGGDLDSFGTISKFRALIPRDNLQGSDKIHVEIVGEPGTPEGGKYKSATLPFGPGTIGDRSLNLDNKTVAFHLGKKMTVTYTIIRDEEGEKTSLPLDINVLPLPKSELKAARIREAQNDGNGPGLDLTGGTADLTLRLEVWPLIAKEQRCWIYLEGKKTGDVGHNLAVLESEPVDEAWIKRKYCEMEVPRSYLAELSDGSELKLIVKVALNQVDDKAQAFDFEERVYTVKNVAIEKPVITKVTGSNDVPVADNGETTDTTLKLEGTAGVGEAVEIFVGEDPKGITTADGGVWKYELSGLSLATHVIKVVTRGQDSNTWTVTVKASAVKPVITKVTDSHDKPVADNGETVDSALKLTVKAGAKEELQFFVNDVSRGKFPADEQGDLTHPLAGLEPGRQVLKVVGVASKLVSNFWTVTVKVVAKDPVITKVTDSRSVPVADKGETTDTTLKLEGTAVEGDVVRVYVGSVANYPVPVVDGKWKAELTRLSLATHAIKVVASVHSSKTWTVKVKALVVIPVISSITDSQGRPVPDQGTTTDGTLIFKGEAAPNAEVNLYRANILLEPVSVTREGTWTHTLRDLPGGDYPFIAKDRRGWESNTWRVSWFSGSHS